MKRLLFRLVALLLILGVCVVPISSVLADAPYPGTSGSPTVFDGPWTGYEYPYLINYTHGSNDIETTSHSVTLPSDMEPGDEIVVILGLYDNTTQTDITYTWPEGWSEVTHFAGTSNVTYTVGCREAVSDNESSSVITITSSTAKYSSFISFLMPIASYQSRPALTLGAGAFYSYQTGNTPQSPNTHLGATHFDYLPSGESQAWVTMSWFTFSGNTSLNSAPDGYTDATFESDGIGGICLSTNNVLPTGPGYFDVAAGAYSLTDDVVYLAGTLMFYWTPSIDTGVAFSITSSSATLEGQIINAAGEPSTDNINFEYRVAPTGDWFYSSNVTGKVTGDDVLIPISGLTPETTYDFVALYCTALHPGGFGGEDVQFTTALSSIPGTVATLPATNVSPTSATLNGNLSYLGDGSAYNVFFQYGLDTSYGSTTPLQSQSAIGLFAANIASLSPNIVYHFRAVAENTTDTLYGSDLTFTTILGSGGGLLQFGGGNAEVFQHYLVPNDLLFVAEIENTYTPYYPSYNPKQYFTVQLISTDNSTVLAATPQVDWGDKPIGIYLNPTQAASITYGGAYYIRVQANFADNVTAQYQLQHNNWLGQDDWKGYDLTKLDAFCISIASNMQTYYGGSGYVTVLTDRDLAITDAVGGYFTAGIAGIGQSRPNLITTSQQSPIFSAGVSKLPVDNVTAYTAYVGPSISADAATFGVPVGLTGRDMLAGAIMCSMLGVIMIGTSAMGGFGALGLFLISIPILWVGTYFKIIGVQWVMLLTIVFGFFAVRQFIIKTT